jgi:hypothetical protein
VEARLMRPRIEAELALLRGVYSAVEHAEEGGEDWFRLPTYATPEGWLVDGARAAAVPIAFLVKADYPGAAPYGFLTPTGLTFNGGAPQNTGQPPKPVPFPGNWLHFSWTAEDWRVAGDPRTGSNLVAWCRSFATRLREGV